MFTYQYIDLRDVYSIQDTLITFGLSDTEVGNLMKYWKDYELYNNNICINNKKYDITGSPVSYHSSVNKVLYKCTNGIVLYNLGEKELVLDRFIEINYQTKCKSNKSFLFEKYFMLVGIDGIHIFSLEDGSLIFQNCPSTLNTFDKDSFDSTTAICCDNDTIYIKYDKRALFILNKIDN